MKRLYAAAIVASMSISTPQVMAQDADLHPYLGSKHVFILGAARQEADAEIRATVDPFPEASLDLSQLGVDETDTTWYLEYRYKINDRWGFIAAAQTFSGSGGIEASRDFNFGGVEFPAGIELRTSLGVDIYFADIMYQVYRSPRAKISLGGGVHAFDFDAKVQGRLAVQDEEVTSSTSSNDLLAPLPNLRAQGFYAFTDRWSTFVTAGWMSAHVDEWDGDFLYVHPRLHYRSSSNFGVAVGYQYTEVDVTRSQKRLETAFDTSFQGPTIHLSYEM